MQLGIACDATARADTLIDVNPTRAESKQAGLRDDRLDVARLAELGPCLEDC